MRLIKQHKKIAVRNVDLSTGSGITKIRHSTLLPATIRALIVGPSNCGKTNALIGLIESPNGLKFENLYIFSKSLHQPKYRYLEKLIKPIKGIGFYTYSDNDSVIPPEKVKNNSVIVFDDVSCESQNIIRQYFSFGRHRNVDSFYLAQTYTRIPKHLIRDNANVIILFKQDEMNMKHVYSDHVGADMTFEKFYELCRECWKEKYGFLMINKDDELNKGRYRKLFDTFIAI